MRSGYCASRKWFEAGLGPVGRIRLSILPAVLLAAGVLAAHPGVVRGQERPAPRTGQTSAPAGGSGGKSSGPGSTRGPGNVLVDPTEDYKIGAGDVIEIQVEDAPELSQTVRVTAAGTFLMPYLGRVTAVQKTPEELGEFVAGRLRGRYLKEPKVNVVVKEYNSCSFFIQGAVRSPGVYQIEGHPSLLKLITLAGLADNHGSTAFILRPVKQSAENGAEAKAKVDHAAGSAAASGSESPADESPEYDLLKVNINGLLRGHPEQNAAISPGDIINIPTTDVFFVSGEVRAPGTFPLREGTTLRQAISMAQGTTFKAATGRGIIFREDPATGKREEVKVDIAAVMSGKKEDVPLLANDIVVVPNSRFKSVGSVFLTGLGTSVARVPVF
jgi:polysaccharide export outer membrane protein